jgi:hypothetical protein
MVKEHKLGKMEECMWGVGRLVESGTEYNTIKTEKSYTRFLMVNRIKTITPPLK